MECPDCGSKEVTTELHREWLPYGANFKAFEVEIPYRRCQLCNFSWRDAEAEQIIDDAVKAYLNAPLD